MTNALFITHHSADVNLLRLQFEKAGIKADHLLSLEPALKRLIRGNYLYCLVAGMQSVTAIANFVSRLRRHNHLVYIILLDFHHFERSSILKLYRAGIDFYVQGPLSARELELRLRRIAHYEGPRNTEQTTEAIQISCYRLEKRRLIHEATKEEKHLTKRQYQVLKILAAAPNIIHHPDDILSRLWGTVEKRTKRSLDVILCKLRKLFAGEGSVELETITRVGFRLVVNRDCKNDKIYLK